MFLRGHPYTRPRTFACAPRSEPTRNGYQSFQQASGAGSIHHPGHQHADDGERQKGKGPHQDGLAG
jgi:hypothetical protein